MGLLLLSIQGVGLMHSAIFKITELWQPALQRIVLKCIMPWSKEISEDFRRIVVRNHETRKNNKGFWKVWVVVLLIVYKWNKRSTTYYPGLDILQTSVTMYNSQTDKANLFVILQVCINAILTYYNKDSIFF